MKKILLTLGLLGSMFAQAQISHVGFGGQSIQFNNGDTITNGSGGYLQIGFDNLSGDIGAAGVGILFGGDSRIAYGGEKYGNGFVGAFVFQQFKLNKSGSIRGIIRAGGGGLQSYEAIEIGIEGTTYKEIRAKHTGTSFQGYGAIGIGLGPVEITYAPAGKMIGFGFRLFKG